MENANSGTNRNYVFTLHLPESFQLGDGVAHQWVSDIFIPSIPGFPRSKFIVFQLEKAPDTGRYHLQGYLELTEKMRFTWIKTNWAGFETAHFERRHGSREQAIAYAEKEETRIAGPWRFGTDAGQGARSDLREIGEKVLSGIRPMDIALQYPSSYIRYHRGVERLAGVYLKKLTVDWNPIVIVFWGDSGSGKTWSARKLAGSDCHEFMSQHGATTWWDGYNGQADVAFQDFGKGCVSFKDFKNLWDNGAVVQVKGDTTRLMPKRIWITSNDPPTEWYPSITAKQDRVAIYRRITYCYKWLGCHENRSVSVTVDQTPEWHPRPFEPWRPTVRPHEMPLFHLPIPSAELPSSVDWFELGSTEEFMDLEHQL